MPRGDKWLYQEPVNRVRGRFGEIQAGQIDFAIPRFEESEVGFQTRGELWRHAHPAAFRSARQPILELAARHEFTGIRPRKTPSTATAAGVTPGIRDA